MQKIIRLYIDSYKGLSQEAWLLALVMLINRTGSMVLPFLSIYMSSELHFSKEQVGIVLGCFGLGAVCGSWLGGWLTDRLGNFKVQAVSLFLVIPLFLSLPYFREFEGLAVMIFILTLIGDTFRPANSVAVARYAKRENLTKAYSLNRMAVNLGFSIGPALGGALAMISYNWIFIGNAIAAFIAVIVFTFFFRNRKARNEHTPTGTIHPNDNRIKDRNAYLDGPFILFNIFCCLFSLAFFQLLSTLPLFYKEVMHMSEGAVGMLLGFNGFVIVLFEMILIHGIERRFSPRNVMVYGTAIAAVSYLMLNIPFGIPYLYLSMAVLCFGEMLTLPFTATISASRATPNTQGAYMGFNSLSFASAMIFSPYLGTYVAEHYGYEILWYASAALLILVSLGFSWILKRF